MIIVGGVLEKDGKFLLVQEAQEKCYGKWNLPAGHLDNDETIQDGAIREIFEETGCRVELTGILEIANKKLKEDLFVSIIFSTKIINEDIKYDKDEILDVKWFTYDEIINMKEELRAEDFIINAIDAFVNNKIVSMDVIKILN
jgi:ADP-ribose pyrophosphatase YjhB (NUDIX family)